MTLTDNQIRDIYLVQFGDEMPDYLLPFCRALIEQARRVQRLPDQDPSNDPPCMFDTGDSNG